MTSPSLSRKSDTGRALRRVLTFALLVGMVSTMAAMIPALFLQSVFVGEAQRCVERQRFEEAAFDRVETTCAETLSDTPLWLPNVIIAGGSIMGVVGGAAYGWFGDPRRRSAVPEHRWLPF